MRGNRASRFASTCLFASLLCHLLTLNRLTLIWCVCSITVPLTVKQSRDSGWTKHPISAQWAECSAGVKHCARQHKHKHHIRRTSLSIQTIITSSTHSLHWLKQKNSGWIARIKLTYFSSLAMSACCESSRISGRLVIMSLWISTGATDTISISLLPKSYTQAFCLVSVLLCCCTKYHHSCDDLSVLWHLLLIQYLAVYDSVQPF